MSTPSLPEFSASTTITADTSVAKFRLTRLVDGEPLRTTDLGELMGSANIADECWLFLAPHDDDLCLGAGLLIQAAVLSGVEVQVIIVTDGCLGYCRSEDADSIVEIRREETLQSFRILGVDESRIHWLGFPDGGLTPFIGRKRACGEGPEVSGYVGLQNSLTAALREHRPARVFVPTPTDLHPDHRITHSELMISLFHATGAIWPELGAPLFEVPVAYELAVYCDFAEPPNLEIQADDDIFLAKLKSIEAYQSQLQIGSLIQSMRKSGPFEYVREVGFPLYCAETYKPLFR